MLFSTPLPYPKEMCEPVRSITFVHVFVSYPIPLTVNRCESILRDPIVSFLPFSTRTPPVFRPSLAPFSSDHTALYIPHTWSCGVIPSTTPPHHPFVVLRGTLTVLPSTRQLG